MSHEIGHIAPRAVQAGRTPGTPEGANLVDPNSLALLTAGRSGQDALLLRSQLTGSCFDDCCPPSMNCGETMEACPPGMECKDMGGNAPTPLTGAQLARSQGITGT